jgi:hypothetical protein
MGKIAKKKSSIHVAVVGFCGEYFKVKVSGDIRNKNDI